MVTLKHYNSNVHNYNRVVAEDEDAVLKVIEARKDREQQARDQAREVFRKLREQRRKESVSRGGAARPTTGTARTNRTITGKSNAVSPGICTIFHRTRVLSNNCNYVHYVRPSIYDDFRRICPTPLTAKETRTITLQDANEVSLKAHRFVTCIFLINSSCTDRNINGFPFFLSLEVEAKSVAMMKTADGLYELSSTSGESDGAGEVDDDLESTLDRYQYRTLVVLCCRYTINFTFACLISYTL